MKRKLWTTIFMGLFSGGWLVLELVGAFDSSDVTRPFTDYVTELPMPVIMGIVIPFRVWLPVHFWKYRRQKVRDRRRES